MRNTLIRTEHNMEKARKESYTIAIAPPPPPQSLFLRLSPVVQYDDVRRGEVDP